MASGCLLNHQNPFSAKAEATKMVTVSQANSQKDRLKMKIRPISTATLLLASIAIATSQTGTGRADSSTAPGICRRDAAAALTGMARLTDEQAKQMTGATIVRQIAPGQGVTMDYRQERITIETDPRTGKIVRAFCG